jgi:glycosyltransferase involved in cell wall biosynthesis
MLAKDNSKERIVVAGKGSDPALSELSKQPNVDIINRFISDDELDDLIKGCIATLLPYDSATQSGVTILSYSYGKPVIAFDVGELGYYIENGFSGYLVQHGDHEQFLERMLLVNECYDVLSENVCNYFQKFNSTSLVSQYNKLLPSFVN